MGSAATDLASYLFRDIAKICASSRRTWASTRPLTIHGSISSFTLRTYPSFLWSVFLVDLAWYDIMYSHLSCFGFRCWLHDGVCRSWNLEINWCGISQLNTWSRRQGSTHPGIQPNPHACSFHSSDIIHTQHNPFSSHRALQTLIYFCVLSDSHGISTCWPIGFRVCHHPCASSVGTFTLGISASYISSCLIVVRRRTRQGS